MNSFAAIRRSGGFGPMTDHFRPLSLSSRKIGVSVVSNSRVALSQASTAPAAVADPAADRAAIIAKLREGSSLIINSANNMSQQLDRLYASYANSATQERLTNALKASYNLVRAQDPFLQYITSSVDNIALLKLQSAWNLGLNWLTDVKDQWFGEGSEPDKVNLHELMMAVDDNAAQEVEAAFDSVQQSTQAIGSLASQVDNLPESMIISGTNYYFQGLVEAGKKLNYALVGIGRFVDATINAAGFAANKGADFLNWAFPNAGGNKPNSVLDNLLTGRTLSLFGVSAVLFLGREVLPEGYPRGIALAASAIFLVGGISSLIPDQGAASSGSRKGSVPPPTPTPVVQLPKI